MSNAADSELPAHQPLSGDEVARAVEGLGWQTLDLPSPASSAGTPEHNLGELRRMTAAQRVWLAFTGKPGSTGRAGPAYEPGLPRTESHLDLDGHLGIPSQRKAAD